MRVKLPILVFVAAGLAACSPNIHLDFLGQEKLAEVVLVPSRAEDRVLVIDVEGPISSYANQGLFTREKSSVAQVYERLEHAAADRRVRGVILRLDTPGGEVTASDTTGWALSKSPRRMSGSRASRGKPGRIIATLSRMSCTARSMLVSRRNSM